MSEAIKKLSWTDDKQKSRAAERHRGMRSIRRRLCMCWPDAALSSSEAHICNRGSPLALPSLTWDENGVVLSLSQHPDRVSDEVMVQHRLLPLRVAYELMTTRVRQLHKPPGGQMVRFGILLSSCSWPAGFQGRWGQKRLWPWREPAPCTCGTNTVLISDRQHNTSDCMVKRCTV